MAKTRLSLQTLLESVLGNRNVYFQPPENVKLKYPCILYELSGTDDIKANNGDYLSYDRYTITLIHRDPDNTVWRAIKDLQYCDLDRPFVADNLYHYVFTLYY